MGKVLLPATAAMDEVATALEGPVVRYDGVHDAVARLRGGDVACLVVAPDQTTLPASEIVRRLQNESDATVVLAEGEADPPVSAAAEAAGVVDPRTPDVAARRLGELRTDVALERASARSSGAVALLREATEAVENAETTRLDDLAERAVAVLGGTRPYPVAWFGRHATDRQVVQPIAAAGAPATHLRAVPVADADGRRRTGPSATAQAVTTDEGVAVFSEPLEGETRESSDADGIRLLALRIPTSPAAVLHLVADRPGGVPGAERSALTALGSALAAATRGDKATGDDDRVRLLADALAHELNNQLGAANLQLDLAEERGDAEHFEHVSRALDRLEGLSAETRALARTEPDRERVTLREVAAAAWESVATSNATLHVEDATLEADAALLRLAMINLLRNAVEHGSTSSRLGADDADEHGSTDSPPRAQRDAVAHDRSDRDSGVDESAALSVEVGPAEGGEGFFVADDGRGIPPDERERVLEWGHANGDGTGVGLGLVRLVAERHGWTVTVSESEAGGARIELGRGA